MSFLQDFADLPRCDRCEQKLYGGSHWHCGACDTTDTTSMYGHHTSYCKVAGGEVGQMHHCGPNGDCELANAEEV